MGWWHIRGPFGAGDTLEDSLGLVAHGGTFGGWGHIEGCFGGHWHITGPFGGVGGTLWDHLGVGDTLGDLLGVRDMFWWSVTH